MNHFKRQLFRNICLSFVFSYVTVTSFDQKDPKSVTGIVDKSVQLKCDLNISDPPDVQWEDHVYSTDRNAIRIFNSTNNTNFTISTLHPNHRSYEVNSDFTLTINLLRLEDDAGLYYCRSRVNNITEVRSYFLTVGELPKCFAKTQLTEGERTEFACSSSYSGNHPRLKWFRGDSAIASMDEYETRLAKQVVHWNATYEDDKQKFTCKMILDEFVEECYFFLDVTYSVRNVTFASHKKEKYKVSDEIFCTAEGNPPPKISFEPSASPGKATVNSKMITVPKSWEGKEITLTCSATNTLGRRHVETKNITIHVAEAAGAEAKIRERLDKVPDNTPVVAVVIVVVALVLLVITIAVILVKRQKQKGEVDSNLVSSLKPGQAEQDF